MPELSGKWLQLVQEAVAGASRVAVLAVPAIIPPETWEAVAQLRAVNGKRRRKLATPDVLLSGHLWCGTCGAGMGRDTAVWKRGPHRGTLYVYYRCRGRRVLGRTHAQTTRKARRLDTAVWQELEEALPDVGDPCPACGLPLAWVRISRAEREASVRIVGTRRVVGAQGFSYLGSHRRVCRR